MKKLLSLLVMIMLSSGFALAKPVEKTLDVLPLFASQSTQQNRIWVGTFQLAWNDLMDGIVKGPVKFEGEKSPLAKQLNKQKFKASDISDSSYYKTYGEISPKLKEQIETAIMEKFNETSDILSSIDWTPGPEKYLVYAMLKKDFKFLTAFDKLKSERFGLTGNKVQFFGIDKNSDKILDDMVNVLFYNSAKDYAVSIRTDGKDMLYLYRTNDNKTFDRLYSDMFIKKSQFDGASEFMKIDELKVPDINLYKDKSFTELCGKKVKGTGFVIDTAIETIEFKMNNEGVKLKSEAMIATKMSMPMMPQNMKPRKFYFDDTFVMFLQENDKNKPYFAIRVKDAAFINKTGRK